MPLILPSWADLSGMRSPDHHLHTEIVNLCGGLNPLGGIAAGKSTLLKLMTGGLEPLDGMVKRHNHLKIGMYHQHLTELLDPELNPLEYMVRKPGRLGPWPCHFLLRAMRKPALTLSCPDTVRLQGPACQGRALPVRGGPCQVAAAPEL